MSSITILAIKRQTKFITFRKNLTRIGAGSSRLKGILFPKSLTLSPAFGTNESLAVLPEQCLLKHRCMVPHPLFFVQFKVPEL